jgi:transposase
MALRRSISREASAREHVCPECRSKAIERVHQQDVFERLTLMLRRRRRYRCLECDNRFYDRPVSKQDSSRLR